MGAPPFSRPRASRTGLRLTGAVLIAVLAAGCSGGGGAKSVTPPTGSQPNKGTASVTFTMHWGTTTTSSAHRGTRYVPVTARSVSVTVNGGTPQYVNAPVPPPSPPISTIVIDAPVGTDTFAFATYDDQNGQGNVLSRASVTQNIVLGAGNVVSAALNGVVVSLAISLSNPAPNAGVSSTVNVNVAAKDADGNTIIDPADYSTPIRLSVIDDTNSGTLSLSRTTLPNSSTTATLTYNGGTLNSGLPDGPVAFVVARATGVATQAAAFTPTPKYYTMATAGSAGSPGFTSGNRPQWIAAGSDGNMWFTEFPGNTVAKITPAGVVTECPAIPTAASNPQGIIGASDDNLWFTEFAGSKITRVTTACVYTENATLFAGDGPELLTDRGDGNIWFTGFTGNHVGFQGITSGVSGETTVPTPNSHPYGIAPAPDLNLYFTENAVDQLGRIPMLFGAITEVPLPAGSAPAQIVRGPATETSCGGGPCMWFTEFGTSRVARLNPAGWPAPGIEEFPTSTASSNPLGIAAGKDSALWFTESGLDRLGRVSLNGSVSEYIPSPPLTGLGAKGVAVAPDGSIWIAAPGTGVAPGRIIKLVY
jgi:virginiamycin B lyase